MDKEIKLINRYLQYIDILRCNRYDLAHGLGVGCGYGSAALGTIKRTRSVDEDQSAHALRMANMESCAAMHIDTGYASGNDNTRVYSFSTDYWDVKEIQKEILKNIISP